MNAKSILVELRSGTTRPKNAILRVQKKKKKKKKKIPIAGTLYRGPQRPLERPGNIFFDRLLANKNRRNFLCAHARKIGFSSLVISEHFLKYIMLYDFFQH